MQSHSVPVNAVDFLKQLDTSNEVTFPEKGVVYVRTAHSVYEYDIANNRVRGGVIGEDFVRGHFSGTTFGGSMIKLEVAIPGSYLEISAEINGMHRVLTTSPIVDVWVME